MPTLSETRCYDSHEPKVVSGHSSLSSRRSQLWRDLKDRASIGRSTSPGCAIKIANPIGN
jgi:hypothetical protein